MSHPTKPVVKYTFEIPGDTFLDCAKKTEEHLYDHPNDIVLIPYKKIYKTKQTYDQVGKRHLVGHEVKVEWITQIGVIG